MGMDGVTMTAVKAGGEGREFGDDDWGGRQGAIWESLISGIWWASWRNWGVIIFIK